MTKIFLFITAFLFTIVCYSQTDNEKEQNVVISKSLKQYRFVKGSAENPVQIKEEINDTYLCTAYRTSVTVAEFYNDVEKIDDVDILISGSGKHGLVPKYEYYNTDGIFYSDAHVCYFQLPLEKKGSKSEVTFKKTTLDPRYFTTVYFAGSLPYTEQAVTISVPSWMQLELKEYNFAGYKIEKSIKKDGDETVYTYSITDMPAIKKERNSPGPGYTMPHLLVLCKSARPKDVEHVYFRTLKDQYDWYRSLVLTIGNDDKMIKEKAEEIISGAVTEENKVKKIYQWVQDNIRYIAFENGIAGFRPEKGQEVLRKKYGDCKGMANLLTEMLRSVNIDARKCWLGTNHIVYDYSTPSLSVDNHMICAWMKNGKPVFLDATEKYLGLGEVAERIQGRQTLIENGDTYLLQKIPATSFAQNLSTETQKFTIEGNDLTGKVTKVWKGENKEWLLSSLNGIKQDKQEDALKKYLAEGKQNTVISNVVIENLTDYNADLKIAYNVQHKNALTGFGNEIYMEADTRRSLESYKIDTAGRRSAYQFPFKNNLVLETEINVPADKTVGEFPEKLHIQQTGYTFKAVYSLTGSKILYRNEIILNHPEVRPEHFSQWNRDIDQLTEFYNRQLVFTQKK